MNDQSSSAPLSFKQSMKCGIFTNPKGEILIVHDQPLTESLEWIEYDQQEDTFCLIFENGELQNLGINLDESMKSNIRHGQEVKLAHIQDEKIQSSQAIVLIIRDF